MRRTTASATTVIVSGSILSTELATNTIKDFRVLKFAAQLIQKIRKSRVSQSLMLLQKLQKVSLNLFSTLKNFSTRWRVRTSIRPVPANAADDVRKRIFQHFFGLNRKTLSRKIEKEKTERDFSNIYNSFTSCILKLYKSIFINNKKKIEIKTPSLISVGLICSKTRKLSP